MCRMLFGFSPKTILLATQSCDDAHPLPDVHFLSHLSPYIKDTHYLASYVQFYTLKYLSKNEVSYTFLNLLN